MEKMTIYYTDASGNKIPVQVKVNKKLETKEKKKASKRTTTNRLKAAVAATALVLSIGAGTVLSGGTLFNQKNVDIENNNTSISQQVEINEIKEQNPNSKEFIIDNASFLIKEAARCGKKLDAEDAVLAVIAANSNDINYGFMGQLFGEKENQTYTTDTITDAYLKTCLIQLETMGIAKTNHIAFNMENIFASKEDCEYLNSIRSLTMEFNNTSNENRKNEIIKELNEIAFELTTYEVNDISSAASVLAMLSLDGMRIVTNNMETPILHDDIRDEMFGTVDYNCNDVNILPTAYSNRVSDLKLDSIKSKLDNAVLETGNNTILADIIKSVEEQTKDVQISDFDIAAAINKLLNVSIPTNQNTNTVAGGQGSTSKKEVSNSKKENADTEKNDIVVENEIPAPEIKPENPVIKPTISNPEVTTPTTPDIEIEENVTPEKDEEIIDTGNVEQNKEEALEKVENEWEIAQRDSNQGSADGMAYGLAGSAKPSFANKSQYYINAFNASYDVYYQIYLDAKAQQEELAKENAITSEEVIEKTNTVNNIEEEKVSEINETYQEETTVEEVLTTTVTYDLNNLSVDQLEELRIAAVGEVTNTEEKDKKLVK